MLEVWLEMLEVWLEMLEVWLQMNCLITVVSE